VLPSCALMFFSLAPNRKTERRSTLFRDVPSGLVGDLALVSKEKALASTGHHGSVVAASDKRASTWTGSFKGRFL